MNAKLKNSMPGRILVLDDEENYAEMLQSLLKQNHFLVDMATKPELALESMEARNYSLVISDYKMPVMDGAAFLKKARENFPDLPVILVSGLMNTPELVKVANMGVTLVLEKPLDTAYFLEQVKRFVSPMTEEEEEALNKGKLVEEEKAEPVVHTVTREYNYLRPLVYMSDESPPTRKMIQEAWDTLSVSPVLFVTGPEGSESEFELLLKEVAHWKEEDERKHHYFSASRLRREESRKILDDLPGDSEYSTVVAVGDISETALDEQAWIVDFIKQETHYDHWKEGVTYLFWVDNLKALNMDLQMELRGSLIRIPPLGKRLGEIAAYSMKFLEKFSREQGRQEPLEMSGAAKNLLLQYPWKGNFAQLLKVLKRSIRLMSDEALPYEALRSILASEDERVKLPLQELDLEEMLIGKQQEILREATGKTGAGLREILAGLGFDVSSMPSDMGVEQLDLLYPEVLEVSEN